jgi:hypothetical protein
MSSKSAMLVAIVVVAAISCNIVAANVRREPKPDPRCPEYENEDSDIVLLPHDRDCSKFLMCSNGLAFEMKCQDGLLFNAEELVNDV